MSRLSSIAVFSLVAALGCGSSSPAEPAIAKAMQTQNEAEKALEVHAALQRTERQQRAQEARALEAKRTFEIEAGAKVPDPPPADLATACDEFVHAFDAWMLSGTDREIQEFWDGRRAELGEHRARCIKLSSVSVAGCATQALHGEYPSLAEMSRAESSGMLLEHCAKTYGPV